MKKLWQTTVHALLFFCVFQHNEKLSELIPICTVFRPGFVLFFLAFFRHRLFVPFRVWVFHLQPFMATHVQPSAGIAEAFATTKADHKNWRFMF